MPNKSKLFSKRTNHADQSLRVIRGKKNSRRTVVLAIVLILVLSFVAFQIYTPTGIYEFIQNAYALTTDTGTDAMTDPNATVMQFESNQNAVFLLSDSYFEIYNSKAKNILYYKHGFADPVMSTSDARILVYDRGGRTYKIFNYSSCLYEGTADGNILSAQMAQNGNIALVSTVEGYAGELYIAGKDQKEIMKWYSTANLLSAVCLRNTGKRVAVSEIYSDGGILSSKVSILSFGDTAPSATVEFKNELITSLFNCNGKLIAASKNNVYVIDWKKGSGDMIKIETEGVISDLECNKNGNLMVVSSREDHQSRHCVNLYDKKFNCLQTVTIDTLLNDIRSDANGVYTVYDNRMVEYDWEGNIKDTRTSKNHIQKIAFIGNQLAAIGTSKISIL